MTKKNRDPRPAIDRMLANLVRSADAEGRKRPFTITVTDRNGNLVLHVTLHVGQAAKFEPTFSGTVFFPFTATLEDNDHQKMTRELPEPPAHTQP